MLKIRFQRIGRKNDPAFRIVVAEHTASPKAGTNVAVVGSYNPKSKETVIDGEAVKGWLGKGAKASGTVHNLLVSKGIIEGKKVNVLRKKTPIVKDTERAEQTQASVEETAPGAPAEETKAKAPTEEAPAEPAAEEEKKGEAPAA